MKYAAVYMLIIAVVLVLLNTYPVVSFRNMVLKSKEASLINNAAIISTALSGLDTLTAEGVQQVIEVVGGSGGYEILVSNPAGRVLYDNGDGYDITDIYTAMECKDVFRGGYSKEDGFVSTASVPVMARGLVIGGVSIRETDTEQADLLGEMQSNLSSISTLIVILTIGMSIAFSALMSMRMNNLVKNVKAVRLGNYDKTTRIQGNDELAEVAREFQELAERLRTDEQDRRRFVSDASHELKTPIAAIRLLSDTIYSAENLEVATAREFAEDISQQAERLAKLAANLLTLTKLDERVTPHTTYSNLSAVVDSCVRMLKPLAQENKIAFICRLEANCRILGGQDDVNLIVFNLLENAIKYNSIGGTVTVDVCKTGENTVLVVEDTGIGIPDDEKNKVFQRFYRVDKARARQRGGSGIGLSIVSGAVEALEGTIEVEDGSAGGSRFTVTFSHGPNKAVGN